ncbi:MAG: rhodanese-like domain-containing protein [Cyclobacteriaceae bacterium]
MNKAAQIIFFILLTSAGIFAQDIPEWSPLEVSKKLKVNPSAVILDVRTPEEFSEDHLAGAINMDVNSPDFEKLSAKLDKKKPVYVYCLGGVRSKKAAGILKRNGYQAVSMSGGIKAWKSAGLPVTKGR